MNRKFLLKGPRIINFADVGIHALNCSANRARDFLHIETGHLQLGVAELRLRVLWRAVPLEVGCERPTHGLEGQVRNAGGFADRLQCPLEIVPDSERRTGFGRKKEIVRLGFGRDVIRVAYRAHLEPRAKLLLQLWADRQRAARCLRYFSVSPIRSLPFFGFLQRLVDAQYTRFDVFNAQGEKLLRAESTHDEESHDEMFA